MSIEQLKQTESIGMSYLSELRSRAARQRQAARSAEAFLPTNVSEPLFKKAMILEGAICILEADIKELSKEIVRRMETQTPAIA